MTAPPTTSATSLYYGFAYAAYVAPEIAYKLSDVDDAMRWGFAHEAGPFQIWDMLGVAETVEKMEAAGLEVADWVKEMLAAGHDSFYKDGSCYDFDAKAYQTVRSRQKHHPGQRFARSGQGSGEQHERQPARHGRWRGFVRIPCQDERH